MWRGTQMWAAATIDRRTRKCSGGSRLPPERSACDTLRGMPRPSDATDVTLGRQGRLVIPAALRRELQLQEGDRLSLLREGDQLVLRPRRVDIAAVRGMWKHLGNGHEVDDLIAERREDARRENEEE